MTNKEAIEQLKQIPIHDGVSDNYMKTIYEAIDMAIKALEQVDKIYKISQIKSAEDLDGMNWEEMVIGLLKTVVNKEEIIHCKDCKYRDYWGDCHKWSKELDAHKTYLLDENMFCGFAEREVRE